MQGSEGHGYIWQGTRRDWKTFFKNNCVPLMFSSNTIMMLCTNRQTSQSTNQATNILLQKIFPNECSVYINVTTAWCILRVQMEEWHPIWAVPANMLNMQSRTADKGWSSSSGLGEVLTTPHRKNWLCYKKWICVLDLDWYFGTT
jgi:hypothetical protein